MGNRQGAVSYARILKLAWPAAVAASITPLLGIIDVWALGQSTRPLDIAAVGIAGVIFSMVYWTFGFIRMSTAGLTAQAAGAELLDESRFILLRGMIIGGGIGFLMVLFQWPLGSLSFQLLKVGSEASDATFQAANSYYAIRIWGAPFALATYALLGWLTARGRTDYLMYTGIGMTLINIVLDVAFVLGFGWGAAGVAAGTLIAELIGFLIAFGLVISILAQDQQSKPLKAFGLWPLSRSEIFQTEEIARTFAVNRDIFIRTLLLAFSFTWFVQRSGVFGDVTLAANQLLLQLFLLTGLAIDGTAIAAETLVGQAIGRRDRERGLQEYQSVFRRGFELALIAAILFAFIYGVFGNFILTQMIDEPTILAAAQTYWPWVIVSPIAVMVCFQLDGIFVGATQSAAMRDSMVVAVIVFLLSAWKLSDWFGNHGLWLAFLIYFLTRAGGLVVFLPRIRKQFIAIA